MPKARQQFLTNLATYRRAAQERALIGASPPAKPSDQSARILRNGLAVAGLALIEDFIKRRTIEVVRAMNGSRLPLSAMPAAIQTAATEFAVRNLQSQVQRLVRDQEDPIPLIETTARALATLSQSKTVLPQLSLHWAESNVRADHIAWILRTLGVDSPWIQITDIALRCGFGLGPTPSMEKTFTATLKGRHAAAHRFDQDTIFIDVRSFPTSALAFAIAFDALASRAARLAATANAAYLSGGRITSPSINLRFIDDSGRGYAEIAPTGVLVANHPDIATARLAALGRAPGTGEVIVQRDRNKVPRWWHVESHGSARPSCIGASSDSQCSDTGFAGSATAGVSGRRPANGVARLGYASEPEIPRRGSVGVGRSDGPQSTIWRLWTQRSDVYLVPRAVARRWKISFHEKGGSLTMGRLRAQLHLGI